MDPIRTSCVRRLVLSFDLSSSSTILEDLSLSENIGPAWELLIQIHLFMTNHMAILGGEIHKFTGDGWILIFPEDVDGERFSDFLVRLAEYCRNVLKGTIRPHLDSVPARMGITIGMDIGTLYGLKVWGHPEYIGRPINIACRLQSAIKDKDKRPEYKALVSRRVFDRLKGHFKRFRVQKVRRTLRNIKNSGQFECVKVSLLKSPRKTGGGRV